MSTLEVAGRKSLMLFSGRAFPELADEIAGELGVTVTPMTARDFANGEIFVRPEESGMAASTFFRSDARRIMRSLVTSALSARSSSFTLPAGSWNM